MNSRKKWKEKLAQQQQQNLYPENYQALAKKMNMTPKGQRTLHTDGQEKQYYRIFHTIK